MTDRSGRLTGDASRRVHGMILQLQARRDAALTAAAGANEADEVHFKASLRGKAKGYQEAIHLLRALERGERLKKRHRWLVGLNPEGGEQ